METEDKSGDVDMDNDDWFGAPIEIKSVTSMAGTGEEIDIVLDDQFQDSGDRSSIRATPKIYKEKETGNDPLGEIRETDSNYRPNQSNYVIREEGLNCEICGLPVPSKRNYNRHILLNHGPWNPFPCNQCSNFRFKTKKELDSHVSSMHKTRRKTGRIRAKGKSPEVISTPIKTIRAPPRSNETGKLATNRIATFNQTLIVKETEQNLGNKEEAPNQFTEETSVIDDNFASDIVILSVEGQVSTQIEETPALNEKVEKTEDDFWAKYDIQVEKTEEEEENWESRICVFCGLSAESEGEAREHVRIVSEMESVICEKCGLVAFSPCDLLEHTKVHETEDGQGASLPETEGVGCAQLELGESMEWELQLTELGLPRLDYYGHLKGIIY